MLRLYALLLPLVQAAEISSGQSEEIGPPFAMQDQAWSAITDGQGRVVWSGSGQATEVVLSPAGGAAGVVALLFPTPTGLVDVSLSVLTEGDAQLGAQFVTGRDTLPSTFLWSPPVVAGKRQRSAARLAPPVPNGHELYFCLVAHGHGTVRVGELALLHEPLPPPLSAPASNAMPLDWKPEGNLDAQAHDIAGTTELVVHVNGLQVSVRRDTACSLGHFTPLVAFMEVRGTGARSVTITGEFPDGVICDPRSDTISKGGIHRGQIRLQGALPGVYEGRLRVSSGKESAALPVRVAVSRGYPAFGASMTDKPGPYQWQLREICVKADHLSTAEALAEQVHPFIEGQAAIPALFFDGMPTPEVLRRFVSVLKGRVGLYSPAWRPQRPCEVGRVQEEAETLLSQAQLLHSIVSTTDLDAACVSPLFDWTANVEGSPENQLLEACFALGMNRFFSAVALKAAPLPVGGVLGESVNDRNRRDPSVFWTGLDTAHYPAGVEAVMEKYDAAAPILTSDIGGPPSTDERLDGLKVARTMALAAYAGATGATFTEFSNSGMIGLTRADGTLSPAGLVVRELSRELAGASPVLRTWSSDDVAGRVGEPIVILPFLRGDEVALVLWNNTWTTVALTLKLRQEPYSEHRLVISRDDPFVSRTYQAHFEFSPQAIQAKRREVYVRLAPLSLQVLRYRMEVPIPTWLESVAFTPVPKGGPPKPERDDRPWWKRLQDWAQGIE